MGPSIGICIPVFNKNREVYEISCRAVQSAMTFAPPNTTILVVDDCSPYTPNHQIYPDGVILVGNGTNRGFSSTVNYGMRVLGSDYLIQMNSDAQLIEDSIPIILEEMDRQRLDVGMMEMLETSWCHYAMAKDSRTMDNWRCGAFWIAKAKSYWAVGGLDESMAHFHSDFDLWKRMEAAGMKIGGTRRTWFSHLAGRSAPDNVAERYAETQKIYEARWGKQL